MSKALITGVDGQTGAYLARLLLEKGYSVWGTTRLPTGPETDNLDQLKIRADVRLVHVELADYASVKAAVEQSQPDEIYHLAAQTSVAESFKNPAATGDITGLGSARLMQAMREVKPEARYFQASSGEIFGGQAHEPTTETNPIFPLNPYAAAKAYAHWITVGYRKAYGTHASCGILFNHESPLRPERFVTRKITAGAARISRGLQETLVLGNLDVKRDWGFAGDYVEAMWRMLQADEPDDYVIATGRAHSIRDFSRIAFEAVGLNYLDYVRSDSSFYRPTDVDTLVGCPDKIAARLGWSATVDLEALIQLLVEADLKLLDGDAESIRYYPV